MLRKIMYRIGLWKRTSISNLHTTYIREIVIANIGTGRVVAKSGRCRSSRQLVLLRQALAVKLVAPWKMSLRYDSSIKSSTEHVQIFAALGPVMLKTVIIG